MAALSSGSKALSGSSSIWSTWSGLGNAKSVAACTEPRATVCVTSLMSSFLRKAAATSPRATRAAVSLADARSKTGLESRKPYFCIPVKSAWPGRGRVSASALAPVSSSSETTSADMTCCHLGHSVFSITIAIGPPIVLPCLTPPVKLALSSSSFIRAPLP